MIDDTAAAATLHHAIQQFRRRIERWWVREAGQAGQIQVWPQLDWWQPVSCEGIDMGCPHLHRGLTVLARVSSATASLTR